MVLKHLRRVDAKTASHKVVWLKHGNEKWRLRFVNTKNLLKLKSQVPYITVTKPKSQRIKCLLLFNSVGL